MRVNIRTKINYQNIIKDDININYKRVSNYKNKNNSRTVNNILRNSNFRNNQNYVLSKIWIRKINNFDVLVYLKFFIFSFIIVFLSFLSKYFLFLFLINIYFLIYNIFYKIVWNRNKNFFITKEKFYKKHFIYYVEKLNKNYDKNNL
jgi:hypothetical protein